MTGSLIKTILLEADKVDAKPSELPELNKLLQENSELGVLFFKKLRGGLGQDGYEAFKYCLKFDESQKLITGLQDEEKIQDYINKFTKNVMQHKAAIEKVSPPDKVTIYKVGLAAALNAVYAKKTSIRLEAYEQLSLLLGFLDDNELQRQCYAYTLKVFLANTLYPPSQIIWKWKLAKEKNNFIIVEDTRQLAIMNMDRAPNSMTISKASLLLGLQSNDESLTVEKITEIAQILRHKLKELADLKKLIREKSADRKLINSLVTRLNDAEIKLVSALNFVKYNWNVPFNELSAQNKLAKKESLTKVALFKQVYEKFVSVEGELKAMIEVAKDDSLSQENIHKALGDTFYRGTIQQYNSQQKLQIEAQNFWNDICTKVMQLTIKADGIIQRQILQPKNFEDLQKIQTELEQAEDIITFIKGSAVNETNVVSKVADSRIDIMKSELSNRLQIVRKKLTRDEELIRSTAKAIIKQLPLCEQNLEPTKDTDLASFLSKRQALFIQINEQLNWLSNLLEYQKKFVENEFKNVVVSRATIQEIVDVILAELIQIDVELKKKELDLKAEQVMRACIGNTYNKTLSIADVLEKYLRSGEESALLERTAILFDRMKEHILENKGSVVDISVKKLPIQPITFLSSASAISKLRVGQEKLKIVIKQTSDQFNEQLKNEILSLLEECKNGFTVCNEVLSNASNLNFEWQRPLAEHLKIKALLTQKFAAFNKKIPNNWNQLSYIDSEVKNLITQLKRQHALYINNMNTLEGELFKKGPDAFRYLLLRNYYKQQKVIYLMQGKHHGDRMLSLDTLGAEMDIIEQNKKNLRFDAFIDAIKKQRKITRDSHNDIGFMTCFHESRLQKMYSDVINKSQIINSLYHINICTQAPDNLDTLQYIGLKTRIKEEIKSYRHGGRHHQDRLQSIDRLEILMNQLDVAESSDRFATLFAVLKNEQIETRRSQKVIGFFGDKKACRLQKVYASLIADGNLMHNLLNESGEYHVKDIPVASNL
jgi:hypothetical protein